MFELRAIASTEMAQACEFRLKDDAIRLKEIGSKPFWPTKLWLALNTVSLGKMTCKHNTSTQAMASQSVTQSTLWHTLYVRYTGPLS